MTEHDHPTLRRLDQWTRGLLEDPLADEVAAHVEECEVCAIRLGRAGAPIEAPRAGDVPSALAGLATVAPALHRVVTAPENPDVAPGQLWRLAWEGTVSIGLVTSAPGNGDAVTVAPVAEDAHLGDEQTIVIPPTASLLGLRLGVWLALERNVPAFVLHAYLGDLAGFDDLADAGSARAEDRRPDVEIAGAPITSLLDERAQYRTLLDQDLASLAAAEWLPPLPRRPAGGLHDLVEGLPTAKLCSALGLETDEVHELLTTGRFLRDAEAQSLAVLTGVSPEDARAAAAPDIDQRLVVAINRPRRRPAIAANAARTGRSEAEERRRLLSRALPVAARRAGSRAAPLDWDVVLDDLMGG